jgi:hypothetical protein
MPPRTHATVLSALAQRFERFARRECHVSPLYERLSLGIAHDPELLDIAARAQPGQPVPNLFLAAVHFLLLRGVQHPLAAFYPSLSAITPPSADPYPSFRAFCLEHRGQLLELISTRLVQTNEVRRCGCLLPAFAMVSSRTQGRPSALVEIGASAGLNLLWDRYGYDYGEDRRYGDPRSPVQIACMLHGERRPPLPAALPATGMRLGIDLHPIDICDPDAALWLRALVWPDERGGTELLQEALRIANQAPPRLIAGAMRSTDFLRCWRPFRLRRAYASSILTPSTSSPWRPVLVCRSCSPPMGPRGTSFGCPSNGWGKGSRVWNSCRSTTG